MSQGEVQVVGDEWKISSDALCSRYGTNISTGLTSAQTKLNKKKYGKNDTKDKDGKKNKEDKKLKKEKKSKDDKKKKEGKHGTVSVTRDGALTHLSSAKLVVGDIVELAAGQEVPAHLRIILSNGLQADTSIVMGGVASPKQLIVDCTHDNARETANVALHRYKILNGTGKGVVIAVGKHLMTTNLPMTATMGAGGINPYSPNISNPYSVNPAVQNPYAPQGIAQIAFPQNPAFPNPYQQNPNVSNQFGPINPNAANPYAPNSNIPNPFPHNANAPNAFHQPTVPNPYSQIQNPINSPNVPNPFAQNPTTQMGWTPKQN